MKREPRILLGKAVDSLVLSIEHFNRPWACGREEAVLILLDRAFELLLKAAIVHRGGRIREPRQKDTIGHDKCVRKCLTDEKIKCLTDDQALAIQMINSLRDAAQHYILNISEQLLYLNAQAGVTLFDTLLEGVFGQKLNEHLPERVLPISTDPPRDLHALMEAEVKGLRTLLKPGSRKRFLARARVRPLAILEASLAGERSQPSRGELNKLLDRIPKTPKWQDLFPGISKLRLDTHGDGPAVSLHLRKDEGEAIQLVTEGTPGATKLVVKRVNELDYYSLGLNQLAAKLGVNASRTLALVRHLDIQADPDYFKAIRVGGSVHKRYSSKALSTLQAALPDTDMKAIWEKHRPRAKKKAKSAASSS